MRSRILAASAVLVVTGCSSTDDGRSVAPSVSPAPTSTVPPVVYPGADWERADAGDFDDLDAQLAADGSTCVAVVKDGRLVHDAYWNGGSAHAQQRVYSIAKSLTSLLVGTAVDAGDIDLDASASRQVEEWRGAGAEAVTVRELLAMTSGRRWSDAADRQMIRGTRDQTSYAVALPQGDSPGDAWVYDNAAVQTLESVLDDVTGTGTGDVVELARQRLLDPLGMRDTTWGRDSAGNALTYSGMTSTCLDLARIGHLMINRGAWAGGPVVSADFVQQATGPSSTLNAAYGLLWWTNAEGRVVEVLRQAGFSTDKAPYEGRIAPSVPADAFWAFGYGNQYVAVVPSAGVVAVRLGARPASPDRVTFDGFTSAVLEAVAG